MARNNEEALQRRERLLAARADCLAQMSEGGRRAFEQQVTVSLEEQPNKRPPAALANRAAGHELGHDAILTEEITNLIAEAHKLRGWAKQGRDIKIALKAIDTALKALELYGRATGQIRDQRSATVTVNVVASREEGLQTAAELLLDLANANELALVIGRLQQRLAELEALSDRSKTTVQPATGEAPLPQLPAAPIIEGTEEEQTG